jgi:GTP diphosphokinase / guanosine-3',5'-bis(diphosphate) 3'-diphosphatase
VVDFAYHVHTDVGNHMKAAKVNGKPVHSDYALKNAEVQSFSVQCKAAHTPVGLLPGSCARPLQHSSSCL